MSFYDLLQKTVLTVDDIMAAHSIENKKVAYRLIREMKNKVGDRLCQPGKIHIIDYCKYYKIDYFLSMRQMKN